MQTTVVRATQILCHILLTVWHLVSGKCPDSSWSLSNSGSCYKLLKSDTGMGPILNASQECKEKGGYLASLRTTHDYTLAKDLITSAKGMYESKYFAYIGGNDISKEGDFKWLDGSRVSKDLWLPEEPNDKNDGEDCTVFGKSRKYVGELGLNDFPCCKHARALVEYVLCEFDTNSSMSDEVFYRKCFPVNTTTTIQTSEKATTTVHTTDSINNHLNTLTETVVSHIQNISNPTSDSFIDTKAGVTNAVSTDEGSNENSTELMNNTVTTANVTKIIENSDETTNTETSYMNDTITVNYIYMNATSMVSYNTSTSPESLRIVKSTRFSPLYTRGRCCLMKRTNIDVILHDLRVVRTNLTSYKRTKVSVDDKRHSVCIVGIASIILVFMFGLVIFVSDFKKIFMDIKNAIRRQPIQP